MEYDYSKDYLNQAHADAKQTEIDQSTYSVHQAHADAKQTINQLLQDGSDDSACRSLATATIKDIKTNVESSQKTYDAVDKGFDCHKEGQAAVVKAKEEEVAAAKKFKDATDARKAACSVSVTFAPRAYNSLKEGECSAFFSDSAYTSAKKKCADSKSAEAKAEGEASASTKAVKSAEEAAAKARAECECKTHEANKKAFEAATKNHEANKKAWVKAHHMICVLDGIAPDKCVHLSVPVVAKAPVCQKCDGSTCNCQGCACGPGNANPIPTWTTDSLLQQSSTSGGNWISTKTITSAPPTDSKLIPHPKYVVNIAYRFSNSYSGYEGYFKEIWERNENKSKYKLVKVTDLIKIPEDTDIMFDIMPDKAYSSTEVDALKNFLDTGFRLILVGENDRVQQGAVNKRISDAVSAMGGGVEIMKTVNMQTEMSAAKKEIADTAVTAGVFKFGAQAFAGLKVDADVTEVLMTDSKGEIFMADQVLRKGRLTIWADINVFSKSQHGNKNGRNEPMFYNLVHQAAFYKKEVKAGRDPNAYANEKLKAEKEGKPPPPKPVVVYTPTAAPTNTPTTAAPTNTPTKAAPSGSGTGDSTCQARCCK
jgi:chemotaxis protein histidine kinase CheA